MVSYRVVQNSVFVIACVLGFISALCHINLNTIVKAHTFMKTGFILEIFCCFMTVVHLIFYCGHTLVFTSAGMFLMLFTALAYLAVSLLQIYVFVTNVRPQIEGTIKITLITSFVCNFICFILCLIGVSMLICRVNKMADNRKKKEKSIITITGVEPNDKDDKDIFSKTAPKSAQTPQSSTDKNSKSIEDQGYDFLDFKQDAKTGNNYNFVSKFFENFKEDEKSEYDNLEILKDDRKHKDAKDRAKGDKNNVKDKNKSTWKVLDNKDSTVALARVDYQPKNPPRVNRRRRSSDDKRSSEKKTQDASENEHLGKLVATQDGSQDELPRIKISRKRTSLPRTESSKSKMT